MTKNYTTETGTFVLLDSDGYVIAKADVPTGEHSVPDHADTSQTFDVDANTDLSTKLSNSPANLPSNLPYDPADTAFEKLANVAVDDRYLSGT